MGLPALILNRLRLAEALVEKAVKTEDRMEPDADGGVEDDTGDMSDLMSRLVRNETTYFYWTTQRDTVDCSSLRKDQMTDHYAKAGSFTTKVSNHLHISYMALVCGTVCMNRLDEMLSLVDSDSALIKDSDLASNSTFVGQKAA
ncbi:hypothetical protein NFI96_003037 [Prochilodus magdalenae]|nr:hypothetical protein NFI96_003037 [Prochilodus magdalenae]